MSRLTQSFAKWPRLLMLLWLLALVLGNGVVSAEIALMDEATTLYASDPDMDDFFGRDAAISNDTVIVGAYGDDEAAVDAGAAYIFGRNTGGADAWGELLKLLPPVVQNDAWFGYAVAIQNDTAIVTALHDDDAGEQAGAAYIFYRNMGGADQWGVVKKLFAVDAAAGAHFGTAVAISNDTVVIGAADDGGGFGAAYVFERNQGGADQWGQVMKLTSFDGGSEAQFGMSVDIDNDTIAVGSPFDAESEEFTGGAGYIFGRNQNGPDAWGMVRFVTPNNLPDASAFGSAVALDNDTLVIGAPSDDSGADNSGIAYIFERNVGGADNWGEVATVNAALAIEDAEFGSSVSIDDSTVAIGAPKSLGAQNSTGSVTLFTRNQDGADSWGDVSTLVGSDSQTGDFIGMAVALGHGRLVAGAPGQDGAVGDPTPQSGVVLLFTLNETIWEQRAKSIVDSAETDDHYGQSVDIDGDVAIVSMNGDDQPGAPDFGAAYILQRNLDGADGWGILEGLALQGVGDLTKVRNFGISVAISGDTAVVGADYTNDDQEKAGAVFVFERNHLGNNAWGSIRKIMHPQGEHDDGFGHDVAISGDVIVVGSSGEDVGNTLNVGAAYVFERNQDGADQWGLVKRLAGPFVGAGDRFGAEVAIDNDTVLVGAWGNSENGADAGAVYIYERNQFNAEFFGLITTLTASDAATNDFFGVSLDISGDTVVVGAWGKNANDQTDNSGAAYIFERNAGGADSWNEVKALVAQQPTANDRYGQSVSIDGDTVIVGADQRHIDQASGKALIYERNMMGLDNWGWVQTLSAEIPENAHRFGVATAISGDALIVGAPDEDSFEVDRADGKGAAYIFDLQLSDTTAVTLQNESAKSGSPFIRFVVVVFFILIVSGYYKRPKG